MQGIRRSNYLPNDVNFWVKGKASALVDVLNLIFVNWIIEVSFHEQPKLDVETPKSRNTSLFFFVFYS